MNRSRNSSWLIHHFKTNTKMMLAIKAAMKATQLMNSSRMITNVKISVIPSTSLMSLWRCFSSNWANRTKTLNHSKRLEPKENLLKELRICIGHPNPVLGINYNHLFKVIIRETTTCKTLRNPFWHLSANSTEESTDWTSSHQIHTIQKRDRLTTYPNPRKQWAQVKIKETSKRDEEAEIKRRIVR